MTHIVSSSTPDWSREHKSLLTWDPSRSLIASIRLWQRAQLLPQPAKFMVAKYAGFLHRIWSIVTGADIPVMTSIGGGLLLPHPNGIVIHPESVIGVNCLIFQQVTLGWGEGGVPRIAGHVDIGAGAKLLGPVVVGIHAKIGANSVVLRDVPAGATVVGCPARVVRTRTTEDPIVRI